MPARGCRASLSHPLTTAPPSPAPDAAGTATWYSCRPCPCPRSAPGQKQPPPATASSPPSCPTSCSSTPSARGWLVWDGGGGSTRRLLLVPVQQRTLACWLQCAPGSDTRALLMYGPTPFIPDVTDVHGGGCTGCLLELVPSSKLAAAWLQPWSAACCRGNAPTQPPR